ncbi:neurofilament heavy polypeptide-like, partial [Asbolus verrucosus]
MEGNTKLPLPEEDEDLEALRLAALQSLKKKSQSNNDMPAMGHFGGLKDKLSHFNGSPRGKHKRGKFSRSQQGRVVRNGQFNGWTRNSNLIAVPMVTEEQNLQETIKTATDVPKLVLPQDRYCKVEKSADKPDNLTSKFDRYNNSDESESESEEESCRSDNEEKGELKRSNSLEDLMAELENEIQGGNTKPKEEKPKLKPKKKRKTSVNSECEDNKLVETKSVSVFKENLKPEAVEIRPQIEVKKPPPSNFMRQRKWRRHNPSFVPQNLVHPTAPPEIIPPVVPFPPPLVQTFPPYNPMGYDNGVYVAPAIVFETPPPQLPPIHVAPPVFERPLSPLAINTEAFSTSTLAPLSPRSAAFVLENRAIIEKRKRRSYSRSPSPPRFRRSKLSKSPKRRSLSPSPVRKVLPPRMNSPKKPASIHDRLGVKPLNKTETDEEKSKKDRPKPKEEKKPEALDPVLEARRKKFERNEITMKEGVIRLRAKEDAVEEAKKEAEEQIEEEDDEDDDEEEMEEIDEDALLEGDDAILLDHKIDALFSDEESDSDNEGRFKTKQETNQKVAVLPFTKLINGAKSDVKTDLKLEERKSERRKRYRSRSPLKGSPKKAAKSPKKGDKSKQTVAFPIDSNRKIEIKIRNPAKYEKVDGAKGGEEKSVSGANRKVEIAKKSESEENEGEAVDEGAEEPSTSNINEGDLRAQLSRKRAERQKHPLPDVVPSRLLQNALQGVGFRKGKKTKNKEENTEGKLPIHMRLGAANTSEVFGKKSRKHKNKGSQEQ